MAKHIDAIRADAIMSMAELERRADKVWTRVVHEHTLLHSLCSCNSDGVLSVSLSLSLSLSLCQNYAFVDDGNGFVCTDLT
jgi:hypothetical protein